ncbi:MAG: TolC family protein [Bacteroidaceae bacterium]|jgi:outer membrane protein|nr:TolC family protein [Bacteroidaceae bacterium]
MRKKYLLLISICLSALSVTGQERWTLRQCIDYALENSIQIRKSRVSEEQGEVSLKQDKAALLPSLSFATSQSVGYRPFEENTAIVQNGQVTNTTKKVTESGSYGLNASWTIWNGGINQKNIEAQKLQNQITELGTRQSEQNLQEQIAQLYVQILYSIEAKKVNEQLAQTAKSQYERGQEMQRQGQMSKADVAQLEAQWKSAEYDIVSIDTQIQNYKRQLKALLELDLSSPFDVVGNIPTDEQVLAPIPSAQSIYEQALTTRPEIRSAELSIDAANMNIDIARRGYYPNIGLSASAGDSHYSASPNGVGKQMKQNVNLSGGVNVSVPIFDNRRNKSAVEQAKLQKLNSELDLQDKKNALSSTIENYWLNANSYQQRFLSAKAKVESSETSYELLDAQFRNGLKNIVELRQGYDNLISAKQDVLQSKYLTLLNMQLLKFYGGEVIDM